MNQVELQPGLIDAVHVHHPLAAVTQDSDRHIAERQLKPSKSHTVWSFNGDDISTLSNQQSDDMAYIWCRDFEDFINAFH